MKVFALTFTIGISSGSETLFGLFSTKEKAEEKAERAVQFRKWANQIVKDYTIKGWVMDDDRLKNDGSILT